MTRVHPKLENTSECSDDPLPLSTFLVVAMWSLPAFGMILYRSAGSDDTDGLSELELSGLGGIILSGWLVSSLWLTNGKSGVVKQKKFDEATAELDVLSSSGDQSISHAKRRRLTRNQQFGMGLIAAIVLMVWITHQWVQDVSLTIAGAILWTTLSALSPSLYRQLSGRAIHHCPGLPDETKWTASSLGIRGLLVQTFCIAAAIAAARRLAGGDLVPLYIPAVMGLTGGLVWLTMILSTIGRKRRFIPLAILLIFVEAIALGQWILLSPTIPSYVSEIAIQFIVSVRSFGWLFLLVMRAAGYRM